MSELEKEIALFIHKKVDARAMTDSIITDFDEMFYFLEDKNLFAFWLEKMDTKSNILQTMRDLLKLKIIYLNKEQETQMVVRTQNCHSHLHHRIRRFSPSFSSSAPFGAGPCSSGRPGGGSGSARLASRMADVWEPGRDLLKSPAQLLAEASAV